ncbi:hypothetical protein SCAPIOD160043 [Staphylococcus capitis]|nr:hypothetical protein CR01_130016 [Staphylococcus capitis CR01]CQD27303.1 hypothetical protein SCAPIOD160043 [Staphylococcus capitis]CQD28378.1 hypothetical protein SCAPIOD240003 [Staphylococcus capitis]CRN10076.1 hypothetical protein BN151710015 [Staphylococcus capitis]CUT97482.1 hypothetical protein BN1317_90076 [Staphylococcus capitis]
MIIKINSFNCFVTILPNKDAVTIPIIDKIIVMKPRLIVIILSRILSLIT